MNNSYLSSDSYEHFMKSPEPSVKHTSYFQVYDELFQKYRNQAITFVEVGVLNGGSLFMWRDFFGKEARIIGIDLNPEAKKWEACGFEIFIGNQGEQEFWSQTLPLIGEIDIILDDGGHTYKQQVVTIESVLSSIKNGGLIVIEDVQTSYQSGYGPRKFSTIEYVKKYIDKVNLRSGEISKSQKDGFSSSPVWSIQTFESIVVFHIDRLRASVESTRIVNAPEKNRTIDYRYLDNRLFRSGNVYKLNRLKRFKIVKIMGLKVLKLISYLDSRLSKYSKYFQ